MEPRPPALGAWSLSHWTTREVQGKIYLWRTLIKVQATSTEVRTRDLSQFNSYCQRGALSSLNSSSPRAEAQFLTLTTRKQHLRDVK